MFWIVGRHQWFIRDDWAFILTRDRIESTFGLDDALFFPQDGHFMPFPILSYRLIEWIFGISSYWPFLVLLMVTHIGCVALVRQLCIRVGASPWLSTLVAMVLLVFGSGWENILFAIQITYNYSLLAFLAQLLLVDHDGRVDRRDYIGSALAVIGVASSGFGPFFMLGVGVLLVARKRWIAAVVAVGPQLVVLSWWWLTWGADPAGEESQSTVRGVLRFAKDGVIATFGGLAGSALLAGTAAIAALAVVVWRDVDWRQRTMLIALWVTALAMFLGIGLQRSDVSPGIASRYQYMAAMMLAPALVLAFDQAHRFAPWARWVPRVILVVAIGRNAVLLSDRGRDWANRANAERTTLALLSGSDISTTIDPNRILLVFSPDVRIGDLPLLVADGAVSARLPVTDEEAALIAQALGLNEP